MRRRRRSNAVLLTALLAACSSGSGGVAILNQALPTGELNQPYSVTIIVDGGTAPYTLSLTAGQLPAGISLSGATLSGTPTVIGAYQFTVTVQDSSAPAQQAAKTLALVVDPRLLLDVDGNSAGDRFGQSVAVAGDVDDDGVPDVIVGAHLDDDNGISSGSARVLSGVDGSLLYSFNGTFAGNEFGWDVSGAGDVNQDGYADVIVGAPKATNNAGFARVFSGQTGGVLYTFNGDSAGDEFGTAVGGAGDVNGDGYDDVIVGAPLDDNTGSDAGSARVFSGLDGSVLYTFDGNSAADVFGAAVSGAGDVDLDGYADLIIGAPGDGNNGFASGSARVVSGVDGSVLYTFDGDSPGDRFGTSVAAAGDVDMDGSPDLIVGAPDDDNNGINSGSARVLSGLNGNVLYTFDGDSAFDQFGRAVSGAGDVDGDGFADVIVGAHLDDENGLDSGSARVLSGTDGAIIYTSNGDAAGDWYGWDVAGVGDGFSYLLISAPTADDNGTNSGKVRVFSGT